MEKEGFLEWNPTYHSNQENERWSHLRAMEWLSLPNFLAPLFGPYLVLTYGWVNTIIIVFIATIIWKFLVMDRFFSMSLASAGSTLTNLLKYPISIIFAIYSYISGHGIFFSISIAFFPIISYFFQFLELPLQIIKKEYIGIQQKKILKVMGYSIND